MCSFIDPRRPSRRMGTRPDQTRPGPKNERHTCGVGKTTSAPSPRMRGGLGTRVVVHICRFTSFCPSRVCQRRRTRQTRSTLSSSNNWWLSAFYVFNYLIKTRRWDNRKQQFYISFQFFGYPCSGLLCSALIIPPFCGQRVWLRPTRFACYTFSWALAPEVQIRAQTDTVTFPCSSTKFRADEEKEVEAGGPVDMDFGCCLSNTTPA